MIYLLISIFVLAPAYIIKINLFGLPSDLLMLWVILVWVIFGIWLIAKQQIKSFFSSVKNNNRALLLFISLFFLSGVISLFAKGIDRAKLGQFLVLFVQPISLFFISGFIFKKYPKSKKYLLLTTYYLLAVAGLYAIIQYITLLGLPSAWWGNNDEPKRAIAFFIHPNFYALWAAPLLALLIPDLGESLKANSYKLKAFLWILGAVGLFLSLSRASWIGLTSAVIVYLIIAANNKIRKLASVIVIIIVIVTLSVPNFRYRVILPFYGEKSTVSRFSLWNTGIKAIKGSPLIGLGLGGFGKNWLALNTDPGLDTHNFPHNIFLDLWVETGLLGLISFLGIISIYIYQGLRRAPLPPSSGDMSQAQPRDREVAPSLGSHTLKLSITLFLIAIIFQGLTDNPYFKNDLAMIFWIILALTI
jgi:putative inorganic carbon (HCO3(-)) transporter